jgi:hypothetical protein
MTTFDKREEGFEKKFAVDEELRFKADARRNRLLGMWVAGKLGISGDEATAYAKQVVASEFEASGVMSKIMGDLKAKGVAVSEGDVQAKSIELMAEAVEQVKAGT